MKGQEQGLERGQGMTASKGTTQSYACKDCVPQTAWLVLQESLPQSGPTQLTPASAQCNGDDKCVLLYVTVSVHLLVQQKQTQTLDGMWKVGSAVPMTGGIGGDHRGR